MLAKACYEYEEKNERMQLPRYVYETRCNSFLTSFSLYLSFAFYCRTFFRKHLMQFERCVHTSLVRISSTIGCTHGVALTTQHTFSSLCSSFFLPPNRVELMVCIRFFRFCVLTVKLCTNELQKNELNNVLSYGLAVQERVS